LERRNENQSVAQLNITIVDKNIPEIGVLVLIAAAISYAAIKHYSVAANKHNHDIAK